MLAQVLIGCPVTGQEIDPELVARLAAWAELRLAPRTLRCPASQQPHRGTKADAWLSAIPRQRRMRGASDPPHAVPFLGSLESTHAAV